MSDSTAQSPLVTVVIPAYNNAVYLGEAIDSVLAQDYRPIELFVVDDGSTDNTAEVVGRYGDRVRYVKQVNQGQSVAKNYGIQNATGEFVAFLDSDDRWHPSKISRQMDVILKNPQVGLVCTDRLTFRGEQVVAASNKPKHTLFRGRVLDELLVDNFVVSSSVLARKSCLLEAGLFDGKLRIAEDYELWLRMARICEFDFVDEVLVEYRLSPTSIGAKTRNYFAQGMEIQKRFLQTYYKDGYPNSKAIARATASKYAIRGDYLLSLGKHVEAIAAYGQALRYEPASGIRYYNLLRAFIPNRLAFFLKRSPDAT